MNNLIIGDTSQLSYYFPNDYVRISSRNINYNLLTDKNWDRVFLCFGESRKYIKDTEVKNVPIMKLHTAPYKILRKLYNFLSAHFKV
jgi:hypothetical protein